MIEFDVGDTEQTVTTTITDNDALEGAESFSATIVALEGQFPVAVVMNATVTVDIVDDDSEWGVGLWKVFIRNRNHCIMKSTHKLCGNNDHASSIEPMRKPY